MITERGFAVEKLDAETIARLTELGRLARGDILTATSLAASGHPGGSMSSIDVYLVLYSLARVNPKDPDWPERDRIIVSHGHTSPGAYAGLGRCGFFDPEAAVRGFRLAGSVFEGHVEPRVPGIEWGTGNLGQGLSAGCAFALGSRLLGMNWHNYVVMGCGEQQKGQITEARRFAKKYQLNNLTAIIDYNNRQISGVREEIMPQDIKKNYESDGWEVLEIDGHDFQQIYQALRKASIGNQAPVMVLANTVMGKGVKFMEGEAKYHGAPLKPDQYAKAMAELGLPDRLEQMKQQRASKTPEQVGRELAPPKIEIDPGAPRVYAAQDKSDNRSAWGKALVDIFEKNLKPGQKALAVFDCDLAVSVKTDALAGKFPDFFFQGGIQEHNTATMAGALSRLPVRVFFADFGVFGIDETFNQERLNDINHANLKLVLTHCGLDVGEDGKTHQCIDYLGLTANLFGFRAIVPADPNQTDRATRFLASLPGNYLLAMGRSITPVLADENGSPLFAGNYEFVYGKIDKLREGDRAAIFTMGALAPRAVKAWEILKAKGIAVKIFNVSCPLELEREKLAEGFKTGAVISYEDHHVGTGLGSRIALAAADLGLAAKFKRMGVKNYAGSGKPDDLYKTQGLSPEDLAQAVQQIIA
jgi:transketolase